MTLFLRVTPNGGSDRIEGAQVRDDGSTSLRLRVKVPPEDGKANGSVIALLAKALRVSKSSIAIVSGETSRQKTVSIAGDPVRLAEVLRQLAG